MENIEGTYLARAKTWQLGEAGTGTAQIAVYFEFTDSELRGQGITWYGYFSEKTTERTIESLRHCGWTGDDLEHIEGLDANEVELVIASEPYEGKIQTRVKWINKPGSMAMKNVMAPERVKSFAAEMKAKIRAFDAAKGKKVAPTPSAKSARKASEGPMSPEPPPIDESYDPGF